MIAGDSFLVAPLDAVSRIPLPPPSPPADPGDESSGKLRSAASAMPASSSSTRRFSVWRPPAPPRTTSPATSVFIAARCTATEH